MNENSIYNQTVIKEIKKFRYELLRASAFILIATLILGAIFIFINGQFGITGLIQGTLWLLAIMLFICVNNLIRIEKGSKLVQGFASVGFIANIIWFILGTMLIWGLFSPVEYESIPIHVGPTNNSEIYNYDDYDYGYSSYKNDIDYDSTNYSREHKINILTRILIVAISISYVCFWISNVSAIKETIKVVKPLKTVAIICQAYIGVFFVLFAFFDFVYPDQTMQKFLQLAALTESVFVIATIAAWAISKTHKPEEVVQIAKE